MFSWSFTMRIMLWDAYRRCLCSEFSLVVVHFNASIYAQYQLFVYRQCGALRARTRGHCARFHDCRMVILQRRLFWGRRRPSPIGFAIPIGWLDITPPMSSSTLEYEDLDFIGCVSCFYFLFTYCCPCSLLGVLLYTLACALFVSWFHRHLLSLVLMVVKGIINLVPHGILFSKTTASLTYS